MIGVVAPCRRGRTFPDIAKIDLAEAGRALAFELPTAAAFQLLRATEQVLRDFYVDWVPSGARLSPALGHHHPGRGVEHDAQKSPC